MKRQILTVILTITLFSGTIIAQESIYFPERNETWEEKTPTDYKINEAKLLEAVQFAKGNEYSGSRDLRIAILKGFEREPFHEILGPTKKRGGPAGMILKKMVTLLRNGEILKE